MTIKIKTRFQSSGTASSPRSLFALFVYALMILSAASATRAGLNHGTAPAITGAGQSSTLMPDGHWLMVGGIEGTQVSGTARLSGNSSGGTVLTARLNDPRAGHSATLLPDGTVLIWGGQGKDRKLVRTAERYDPSTQTFSKLVIKGSMPRTAHTATLLTDGRVLIAGGVRASGEAVTDAQLWDPQHSDRPLTFVALRHARRGAQAQLLSDGRVLLSGGGDPNDPSLTPDEVFDPQNNQFSEVRDPSLLPVMATAPEVVASIPARFAQDGAIDGGITLRFATLMRVETLNAQTVTLIGPAGALNIQVIPAESGRLLFVHPQLSLVPGTSYTLFVNGAKDSTGKTLPFTAIDFTTQTLTPKTSAAPMSSHPDALIPETTRPADSAQDQEAWEPSPKAMHGDWRAHRAASNFQSLPALQAKAGVTALAGQVLKMNGKPLPGVTLKIGTITVQSDHTGRFLLQNIPTGAQVLVMDGRSAGNAQRRYGYFETRAAIAAGKTTVLSYTIWMTKLDTAHAATIPAPTSAQETVITTPLIPGLELHIPKGTVVRGPNGNIETQISITAIPVDRTPFPLPPGVPVPVYFTIQPGGSTLESADGTASHGARLIYPNFTHEAPGAHVNFWNYDPRDRGWYVYGQGTVNADGQQVTPASGVAIYEFTGAMISSGYGPPPNAPPPGAGPGGSGGEPVDLATGLFVYNHTDLTVQDVMPLSLRRTYRTNDTNSYRFGIGTTDIYGTYLFDNYGDPSRIFLVLPDGAALKYVPSGSTYLCQNCGPTDFYGSTITGSVGGGNLTLTRKDGTVYVFSGSSGKLASIIDRVGNHITLVWSGGTTGNLTSVTSPNGKYITFTYDASNRVTQAKDNFGRTVSYTYDTAGRLSTVTDAGGGVTKYTYDTANNMVSFFNPRNNTVAQVINTFDTSGRVQKQQLPDGSLYQFAYTTDTSGKITQTDLTDPNGKVRRVAYNTAGYITSETRALGLPEKQTTTTVRDATNHITSTTDALGRVTSYVYDTLGNVTSTTRLFGTVNAVTTSLTYEPTFSQVTSITDPLNHVTSFTYDSLGNLTKITDPLGNTTTFTSNSQGQPLTITNGLAKTTQFSYSYYGDLVSITDPLSHTVQLYNDAVGRIGALTDPTGATTIYQRDNLDRLTAQTDPLGNLTQYGYDADGDLTSVKDALNHTTTYGYDNKDRLVSKTDPLTNVESYQYDGNDNLKQRKDGKGQITTYLYDGLNRRTKTTYADASTTTSSYDAGDRVTQVIDSVGGTLTRGYDGLDRLTSETSAQGSVSYSYDAANRRTQMTVPGQSAISYAYDNANRLTTLTQGTNTVSLSYDNANRRTTLTLPNGISMNYGYDNANQLTGLTYKKGTTTLGDLGYNYDNAGRRTQTTGSYARTSLPAALTGASYNATNQLTTWGTTALSYDANGSLTANGSKTFTWDARNQLASLSATGLTAAFQYDAIGRRKTKTINGTTTNYLYDGINTVQEQSATGTVTANLLTGLGIDEVYTRSEGSVARQLLSDALGSTVALTDATGAIQTSYTYEPYGKTTQSGAASTNSFQYTGRENDGTGLYYYRARYYDPTLPRFLSEDPIGLAGGINGYLYANASPVNFTDPWGENPVFFAGEVLVEGIEAAVTAGRVYVITHPEVPIAVSGAVIATATHAPDSPPDITSKVDIGIWFVQHDVDYFCQAVNCGGPPRTPGSTDTGGPGPGGGGGNTSASNK
ncbi:MAG: RHS repeat-associated core domain-containing protein [Gammaproteobacteria bacterium]